MADPYKRHRVQFDVDEELFDKLNAMIPPGVKRFVYEILCRELVRVMEKSDDRVRTLASVMRRKFQYDETLTMEMLDGLERSQQEPAANVG